jgi:hypothetical protein
MSVDGDNRLAHGGKAIYGARLGILMLEARFPRIPGDMGNAGTWPFPVLYKVVSGASPQRVVREKAAGCCPISLPRPRSSRPWAPTASRPIAASFPSTKGARGGGLGAGAHLEPHAGADDPEHVAGRQARWRSHGQRRHPDDRSI